MKNGVHFAFIDRAKRVIAEEGFEQQDKQFALIIDEMKIKSGLVCRKHTGELVGFCDLGTVNQEFEELTTAGECSNLNPTPKLAEHMLMFMICSIFSHPYPSRLHHMHRFVYREKSCMPLYGKSLKPWNLVVYQLSH